MFDLIYNIDFEVTAFLFTLILFIETMISYPKKNKKNYIFLFLTFMTLVTEAFDIISAYTNTYGAKVPVLLNKFVNSGYFMSGLLVCFLLHYYVEVAFIPREKKWTMLRFNQIILYVVEFTCLLNWFFGYYFYFSPDGTYMHGSLYLMLHLTSMWFVICASFELFTHRRSLKRIQFWSGVLFILLYFTSVVLQTFFVTDVLLIMPAASVMVIIALFNLETPDYQKLQRTLQELTETKKKLEIANEEYKKLAHRDLMTGLYNRSAYITHMEQFEGDKEKMIFLEADINNLKYINDNYGHIVGDEMIKKVADILEKNFRTGCQCYRIGGDEFSVIGFGVSKQTFEKYYCKFIEDVKNEDAKTPYPFTVATAYQEIGSRTLMEALKEIDYQMYVNKGQQKALKDVKS